MSLNEIKKEFQIAGKGHNVIFEIAILMKHTIAAKNDVDGHVPENGGTCQFTKLCRSDEECVNGLQLIKRMQESSFNKIVSTSEEEGVNGLQLMSKECRINQNR
jgi:hypothetical protein